MDKPTFKILIIDDSAEDRAALRRFLEQNDDFIYSFLEAETGEAGIEICFGEKPDCVLLDDSLPDTDGLAVIKTLNPDLLDPAFPVILLTAAGNAEVILKAVKNGAQNYLVKNEISPEELALTVYNAIEIIKLRGKHFQAEKDLRESEELYRSLFELAAVGIARADGATGRFEEVNDEFCRITGYSREELLALDFPELTHPDDRAADREMRQKLAHGEQNQATYTKRYVRKDGQIIWVQVTATIVRDEAGKVEYGVSIVEDITENKQAEENLRVSEERLKLGVEVAAFAICEIDYTSGMNHLSIEAAKLYGLGDDAMTVPREVVHATFHPDDAKELAPLIAKSLNPDGTGWFASEHRVVWKNGEVRWLSIRKQIFFDRTANPPRPTIGILAAHDITERKKAEVFLRESEERLRVATDAAEMYAWEVDVNTRAIKYGDNHARVLGFALPADFAAMQKIIHPDDRAESLATFENALADGTDFEGESRLVNPSTGAIIWICTNGVILKDGAGNPSRVFGVVQNITRRKVAEEALLENQRFTESIIETAPTVLYTFDLKTGSPLYLTNQSAAVLGYSFDEVKDNQADFLQTYLHPEDAKLAEKHFRQISRTNNGEVFEFEYRMRHKSGEWRWFHSRDRVFKRDENGKPSEILGIATDITERKKAADELRESDERIRLATEATTVGIWEWNVITDQIRWDAQMFRIYGIAPTKDGIIPYSAWSESVLPEELQRQEERLQETVRLRGRGTREFRVRRNSDGEIRSIHAVETVRTNAEGQVEWVLGTNLDITERKQADEELRASEERFRRVLAQSNAGIVQTDAAGRMTLVNQRWCEMLGYSEAELLSMRVIEVTHSSSQQATLDVVGKLAAGGPDFEIEKNYQRKDGSIMPAVSNVSALRGKDGEFQGLVAVVIDITERIEAEAEIKALSNYNREVLESITDPLFTLDREWRFTYMSRQGEEVVMREPGELLGKVLWEEFPGLIGSPFENLYRQAMNEGIAGQITDFFPDHQRWYEVNMFPSPTGVTVYFRNVTERIQVERNLAFLANLSKDFASLSSADEIMEIASARIAEYLNLSHCLFVEINAAKDKAAVLYDHRAADTPDLVGVYQLADFHSEAELAQLVAGNAVIINDVRDEPRSAAAAEKFEALGIRALTNMPYVSGGQWKFTLSAQHSQPHQWRADETEILSDLAARFWTRLERARAEEKLRESEERFRVLFDSIDEGFCIIEMIFDEANKPVDYRFVQANPAMERLTGLTDVLGKTVRELVPDLEDFWFETYGRVALTGEVARFENEAVSLNRWFEVYASRVGDSTNRLAVVFNNITERKLAERERERLLEREQILRREAEDANRAKDEFLAVLSHELRTPLNSIKGWVSMLQHQNLDDAKRHRAIEVISRNVNSQNALIEDILDVSRIISNKMRLEIESHSFISILQNVIETMRPVAENKGISLRTDLDETADLIEGDAFRLQQIISNLLNNAIKFTPAGGSIAVNMKREGDTARLTIADTGIGIAPELLTRIFDRFQQADGTSKRQYNGLGLGLAIVKHLAELHGGSVSAMSAGDGKGATFTVELPLISQTSFPFAETNYAAQENEISGETVLADVKLLVVDDDPDTLELMRVVLESCGANAVCVDSANKALEKLAAERFDLIVSDVGMAGTDGYDLIRTIRQTLDADVLPAIALSGYVSADDREKSLSAGFQMHLGKPVNIQTLPSTILSLLKS